MEEEMKKIILQITTILFTAFSALTNAQWFPQNSPSQNDNLLNIFDRNLVYQQSE